MGAGRTPRSVMGNRPVGADAGRSPRTEPERHDEADGGTDAGCAGRRQGGRRGRRSRRKRGKERRRFPQTRAEFTRGATTEEHGGACATVLRHQGGQAGREPVRPEYPCGDCEPDDRTDTASRAGGVLQSDDERQSGGKGRGNVAGLSPHHHLWG